MSGKSNFHNLVKWLSEYFSYYKEILGLVIIYAWIAHDRGSFEKMTSGHMTEERSKYLAIGVKFSWRTK